MNHLPLSKTDKLRALFARTQLEMARRLAHTAFSANAQLASVLKRAPAIASKLPWPKARKLKMIPGITR